MSNKNQRLTMIFLVILCIPIISSMFIPNAEAVKFDTQQHAISTLNEVVGLDTTKYVISATPSDDLYRDVLPRESLQVVLTGTNSKVNALCTYINGCLEKIYICDKQGSLLFNRASSSDSSMARNFLSTYEAQSKNVLYGQLGSMIEKVDTNKNSSMTLENVKFTVTALNKDTTFRWTYTANGIEAPDKCVILRYTDGFLNYFINDWDLYKVGNTRINFSEQDAIDVAIARARNYSPDSDLAGTVGGIRFNVTNAIVVEKYLASPAYAGEGKTRSEDSLELYPMYNVWVSLDAFYPGNVYGFNVYIWADTGDPYYIHERVSTVDPPTDLMVTNGNNEFPIPYPHSSQSSDNNVTISSSINTIGKSLSFAILFSFFAFTALMVVPYFYGSKRKNIFRSLSIYRSKVGRILLYLSIFNLLVFPVVFAPVVASNVGGTTIWGAESTGAINYNLNPPESWRKTNNEVTWQRNTASYIDSLFDANGYISHNNQGLNGSTSDKGAILNQIQYFENNFDRVVVVDFDHGNGVTNTNIPGAQNDEFHYMFEDNWGTFQGAVFNDDTTHSNEHAIFDSNIYENTVAGKTCFAFINTCNSAHVDSTYYGEYVSTQGLVDGYRARGMPFAWSHGLRVTDTPDSTPDPGWISRNGFSYADSNEFCFIGFEYGSAALDQSIDSSDYHYYYWLHHFFYYALQPGNTIHTALNLASQDTFYGHPNFDESPLFRLEGFMSIWPMYINERWNYDDYSVSNSHMRVYGNSNIKLYQPQVAFSCVDDSGFNNPEPYEAFNVGGETTFSGSHRLIAKNYVVTVPDTLVNYDFSYFTFNGVQYSQGANIPLTIDGNLVAHYNWVPEYRYLDISSGAHGAVSLIGNQQVLRDSTVAVHAYPDSGYIPKWTSDAWGGEVRWNTTAHVYMHENHWLHCDFVAAPNYNFVSSVKSTTGEVHDSGRICGPYPDGQYGSISVAGPYNVYGDIVTQLYYTTSGHIYIYGSASGGGPLNVYTSPDGNNWDLVGTPSLSSQSLGWIDCGYSSTPFNYIAFSAQDSSSFYTLYIDSVKVDPTQYTLTISSSGSGYTTPSGSPQYTINSYATVLAVANSQGIVFDHWTLNGTNAGNNPSINIYMDANYLLQAVFVPAPSGYVSSIIDYSNEMVNNPNGMIGSSNDGQWTDIYGLGPYGINGWITGALNAQTTGHVYVYGYGYGPIYVHTSAGYLSTVYPSSSPALIDCGTCTSPFNSITFVAADEGTFAEIHIDSVNVEPPTPEYSLTTNIVGSGSVTKNPNESWYLSGTPVQLTAVPASGYQFASWSGALTGSTNPATIVMDDDKTVTATFTAIPPQYTLTVNVVGSGNVTKSPSSITYASGTQVELTAVPDTGYLFAGWSGSIASTNPTATVTMNEHKTITATFTPIPEYTLTVNIDGHGSVTKIPDQATYNSGTSVQLTAAPAPGYQFASWSGSLSGSTNPTTIVMDGNKIVTATFTQIPQYTLAVNIFGNGSVTKNPNQAMYTLGTPVELTANPSPGWAFTGWNGDLMGSTNPTMINMNANKEVIATFTQLPTDGIIFSDDFSSGNFNSWTTTYNNPTISDDKAVFNVPTGDGSQCYALKQQLAIANDDIFSASTRVSFNTIPSDGQGNSDIFFSAIADSSDPSDALVYAFVDGSQHFGLWIGEWPNYIAVYDNTMVQANTYYNITIQLDDTNQVIKLLVNGQETITHAYTINSAFQNSNSVDIVEGIVANYHWAAVQVKLDDVIVAGGTPPPIPEYTLTVNTTGSGSVTKNPDQTTYTLGTNVTLTAVPNAGYQFASWTGALTGSTNPATITMDSNKTVTAAFQQIPQGNIIFSDDFSNGSFNAWTSTYNNPTITDGKAIFNVPTGDGTQCYAEKAQLTIDSDDVFSVSTTVSFNTVPNTGQGFSDIFFSAIYDPSSGAVAYALLDGSQHFGLWIGEYPNQVVIYDDTAVQADTYYNITIQLDNANQLVKLLVNEQTTITHAYTSYSQFQNSNYVGIVEGIVANYDWTAVQVRLDQVTVTTL